MSELYCLTILAAAAASVSLVAPAAAKVMELTPVVDETVRPGYPDSVRRGAWAVQVPKW
jgi:hypothetical protein